MKNGNWRIDRSPSMTSQGKKAQYEKIKSRVFGAFNTGCNKCGFQDHRALQIDHINGGGNKERVVKRGTSFLYHVLKNPALYQILCANCNWIKRFENNEIGVKEKSL